MVNPALKLSNDHCDLALGETGVVLSLFERAAGREWQARDLRVPLFAALHTGVTLPPTRMQVVGDGFHLEFAQCGFACSVSCRALPDHFLFKVESVSGPAPDAIGLFGIHVTPDQTHGELHFGTRLNTVWDDSFSVTLLALNPDTEARSLPGRILQARAHQRFGLEGAGCALLTVPTVRLDQALVDFAVRYNLPQPTLDGKPAKLSPMVRRGYLFTDFDAANADRILDWAKRGRFAHVVMHAGSWHDRAGHYRVHPERIPGGTPALRAIAERFHRADIGVGIHLGSADIGWEDPYMTPVPDRRLATGSRFRLSTAVGPNDPYLTTDVHPLLVTRRVLYNYNAFGENTAALASGTGDQLDTVSVELDDRPFTVRVDDELIRVRHLMQGMGFEVVERGLYGTQPAPHAAGGEIVVLRQLYNSFLLDVYTSLLDEVADSVARIYNECQLDMIYFDCGEGFGGPPWHARARVHDAFLRRFDRECLAQGSDHPHYSWHWFARYGTSDCVPSQSNAHVDHTRVPRALTCRDNRMPADMGWFQLYAANARHAATTPAEAAYLCERADELNAGKGLSL